MILRHCTDPSPVPTRPGFWNLLLDEITRVGHWSYNCYNRLSLMVTGEYSLLFLCSFVLLENSYGFRFVITAAQCTPEGSVWHYWNSNKAVDCITCFNLDDIGWDFISVSYRLIRHDPEWKPPPVSSIDYCYVQPHHIPSVNAMCREFFWPGIDCKF